MEFAFAQAIPLPLLRASRPRQICLSRMTSLKIAMRRGRPERTPSTTENTNQNGKVPESKPPPKRVSSLSQSEYARAMQLATRRDKRPARNLFRTATEAYPSDGRLWLAWAQMEQRTGDMRAARGIFADGTSANPENVRLLHAWAVAEDRASCPQAARRLFQRCLDVDPSDGLVWQCLALLEERHGDTAAARDAFQEGVIADESNPFLWSAWGVLEFRHQNYEKAAGLFERAMGLDPSHAHTCQSYALTAEKLGQLDKSERLFRHALKTNPRSVPTYQAFALFESRRGNLDIAREYFQKGVEMDSTHAPLWHAWAVMEQQENCFDTARELFQRGVRAAPKNKPLLRAWARMELQLGHIDKSSNWRVPSEFSKSGKLMPRQRRGKRAPSERQMSTVAENLMMLRLMIERKSDDDLKAVMTWLDHKANEDRKLYDALAERQTNDLRTVREWVERRSAGDISSFKKWLDDRYKKDRRVGVYLFNWEIPPLPQPASQPVSIESVAQKPTEWLRLEEQPARTLQLFDEEVYFDEKVSDYADGIHFLGRIAEGLVDRAALSFILCAMSLLLIGASAQLENLGYSPAGDQSGNTEGAEAVPPPSGVDAYLYEDGGAEAIVDKISQQTFGKKSGGT